MLKNFRLLAVFEGISFLLILFITMPLKYMFDYPMANKVVGMIHGVLFLAYIVFALMLKTEMNWNNKKTAIILLCSVIPFGTFWMDKKYFSN